MNIAVDAMGGDYGVKATVDAAVRCCQQGITVTLVGHEDQIGRELKGSYDNLNIVHAETVISGEDQPVSAVRRGRDSSLVVGIDQLKQTRAEAFVSAGNTGGLLVAGKLKLGCIDGIDRPALGSMLPTVDGRGCFMLDLGAATDARPDHLLHYAIMADAFVRLSKDIDKPRVGLLNVGSEEVKGTEIYRKAYELLNESVVNFVGNIEGRDLLSGNADVVVCDGFVGNIVLKFAEGMGMTIFSLLRQSIMKSQLRKLGAVLSQGAFGDVKKVLDYREYGGAPLLGINGIVVKCHGSSDASALANGIVLARDLVERKLVAEIGQMTGG